MKVLDLFCGLGGWSKGFASEGFDCTGVDVVNVGYPYRLIIADVATLDPERFRRFDVVVGSPPCRDFSRLTCGARGGKRAWKDPPNPQRGLQLVHAFLDFIAISQPAFWLMENVRGLTPYLKAKPVMIANLTPTMRRWLWGNFPLFLVLTDTTRPKIIDITGKYRSWERAQIPFYAARSFARACKAALTHQSQRSPDR